MRVAKHITLLAGLFFQLCPGTEKDLGIFFEASRLVLQDNKARFGALPIIPSTVREPCFVLTWIPTFAPPVRFVLYSSGKKWEVEFTQLNGRGGHDWGAVASVRTATLTKESAASVLFVRNDEFWKPFNRFEMALMFGASDGEEWCIEQYSAAGTRSHWVRNIKDLAIERDNPKVRSCLEYARCFQVLKALLSIAATSPKTPAGTTSRKPNHAWSK
jgi:hypothetical protein